MVPPGFILRLWPDGYMGGERIDFHGQADENGKFICQDLGLMSDQMSDSEFFRVVFEPDA